LNYVFKNLIHNRSSTSRRQSFLHGSSGRAGYNFKVFFINYLQKFFRRVG